MLVMSDGLKSLIYKILLLIQKIIKIRISISLYNIYIMLLQASRQWKGYIKIIFFFRIFYLSYFMMSYKLLPNLFFLFKLVVIQSGLVCYLLRYKLSVVSSWNAFINYLLLFFVFHKISVYELSHIYVVSENIYWEFGSFSYSNELFIRLIDLLRLINQSQFIFYVGASINSGKRSY